RLINSGVKTDQHPTRLAPDVFNRVPIALRNVTDIAGVQLLRSKSTMRAKHRHAEVAFDYILPFVGVWMPMKFAQRAWFEVENHPSDCCRNWKSSRIDASFAAAFENRVRRTCKHSKFVRLRWRDARLLQIFRNRFWWDGAASKINFLLWKAIKFRFRQAEIFCQERLGRMPDPIRDTECAELREIAVVKDQNEMSRFVAETLEHMGVTTWKVPDVAGFKVVRLCLTSRIDDRSA